MTDQVKFERVLSQQTPTPTGNSQRKPRPPRRLHFILPTAISHNHRRRPPQPHQMRFFSSDGPLKKLVVPSYGASDNDPPSPSIVPNSNQGNLRISNSPLLGPSVVTSPRRDRVRAYDLEEVAEEDEDDADEPEALVDIPYSILVRNYTLVPISAFLFLAALIALFTLVWPPSPPRQPHPHYTSIVVGAFAWIISYTFRLPIFTLATFFNTFVNGFTVALSTILSIAFEETLRLGALVLLGVHLDDAEWEDDGAGPWPRTSDEAFHKTFWIAVGWALVEVAWSISQGYEQLALYRDVLPPSPAFLRRYWASTTSLPGQDASSYSSESESVSHRYVHAALKKSISPEERPSRRQSVAEASFAGGAVLDAEMRELLNLQSRLEIEMVYGVPPPNIPVFISILQRIDSILLTLGLTLSIAGAYLTQLAPPTIPTTQYPAGVNSTEPLPSQDIQAAVIQTLPTWLALVVLHSSLALMWTEGLPRIGIHTASYAALLVSLGVFFTGLAWWGALS